MAEVDRDCVVFDGGTEGLTEALLSLHRDPDRRRALADHLHAAVATDYSWDAAGARISDWIEEGATAPEAADRPGRASRPVLP